MNGGVALADRCSSRVARVTATEPSSAFAGFRFPREVITVPVRYHVPGARPAERAGTDAGVMRGGGGVGLLERRIAGGRHVEVQVIADSGGAVWTPGVRDCTILWGAKTRRCALNRQDRVSSVWGSKTWHRALSRQNRNFRAVQARADAAGSEGRGASIVWRRAFRAGCLFARSRRSAHRRGAEGNHAGRVAWSRGLCRNRRCSAANLAAV